MVLGGSSSLLLSRDVVRLALEEMGLPRRRLDGDLHGGSDPVGLSPVTELGSVVLPLYAPFGSDSHHFSCPLAQEIILTVIAQSTAIPHEIVLFSTPSS